MAVPFLSLQMPSSTQRRNFQTKAVKAYRQYIYRHCHVTPSCAVVVGVCILMLPVRGSNRTCAANSHLPHEPPLCSRMSHDLQPHPSAAISQQCTTSLQPHPSSQQCDTSHGPPEQSSVVKYQMSVIPLQSLARFPQPRSHWSGEEGGGGGDNSTAPDEWRHRDEPRTCW